jgi:ribosomal protein S18 acetylase RimI-like enzyme
VVSLWRACELTRGWNDPEIDFRRAVAGASSCVLIMQDHAGSIDAGGIDAGRIDASVMVGSDGHRGWVYYLAVAPQRRREGLGRAIMEAAETRLRDRGIGRLRLMLCTGNPAVAFYERLGYEEQAVSTMGKTLT